MLINTKYDGGTGWISRFTRAQGAGQRTVALAFAATVVSVLLGLKPLTPILQAVAIYPFLYQRLIEHDHSNSLRLLLRWGAGLFVTALLVSSFAPGPAAESFPMAAGTVAAMQSWVSAGQAPPFNYGYILIGSGAVAGLSLATGGLLGCAAIAVGIDAAAYGAFHLFRNGNNVFQVALVAVPLWGWAMFAAHFFLVVPFALPLYQRLGRIQRVREDTPVLRRFLLTGAGLVVLAIILRVAGAGLWRSLVSSWTIL